jgi:phospholipid/cholesterol/gamma-HCH transport system substrate-binding protein
METRYKFRHVNELTGLFVLGVVAVVVAGLIFSGHSQRWFARKFSFQVLLPEAGTSGLRRGDEVFILGVSAGMVDDIIVADDGRMKARVKVGRDFERFVRTDSTASIKKAFAVAGDSFMEISRGSGVALPRNDPVILCLPSEDSLDRMEKMLADLRAELVPVVQKAGAGLEQWTKLGADLQQTQQKLSGVLTRLDHLALGLEEGKGTAGKLLNDNALADEARKLLSQANETMSQLQVTVTNLDAAVKDVRTGSARFPEIANSVAAGTKELPGLVDQTQTSMRELERLIEGLQRNWLVRKYINHTNPQPSYPPAGTAKSPKKSGQGVRSPADSSRGR